jgi:hypothetical protein
MNPIGIKYYLCMNNGVGVIIYPQLRGIDNPTKNIIWNGQSVSDNKYMTTVG